MRHLGQLPDAALANRFADYALVQSLNIRCDEEPDGSFCIWCVDEDDLKKAQEEFAAFLQEPNAAHYSGHAAPAKSIRAEMQQKRRQAAKNLRKVKSGPIGGLQPHRSRIPLTVALIVASVLLTLYTGFGSDEQNSDPFWYVSNRHQGDTNWDSRNPVDASVDVLSGQLWRVITPAFVHLSVLHIVFNMMWLHMLGGQIETRSGKWVLAALVLATEIASVIGQVVFARYPFFGGMSGVVYGLFGFIWMKWKFEPWSGYYLSQRNIQWMLLWFVICFLPGTGVANGGHAGGLVAGAAIGYISANFSKR